MIDNKKILSILQSIKNLDEKGKLDPQALKQILKENLSEILVSNEQIEFLKDNFNFVLETLVAKSIISEEEKSNYVKMLGIKYGGAEEILNKNIILNKSDYTEEEKKQIVDNSYFKGFFFTYDDLIAKYPKHKSSHGWRAIIMPDPDVTPAIDVNDVKEYAFDIHKMAWLLTQDRTIMRNYMPRIDTDIIGREKGSPLDNDFLVYLKNKERWQPFTRNELDLASRRLLHRHLSSLLSTEVVSSRRVLKSKLDVESERDIRTAVDENIYYRDLAENDYNITYEEMKSILDQVHSDYDKLISIDYPTDSTLGHVRPLLHRDSLAMSGGKYVEDSDNYGTIRKNIDNPTLEKLIKTINDDFYRDIDVSHSNERILEVLGETLETTAVKDLLVPRNISKQQFNKIIKQINNDYLNVIDYINSQAYNSVIDNYVNSLPVISTTEKNAIKTRLHKSSDVFRAYVSGVDYQENTKNKTIQMEVLNQFMAKINELEMKIDVSRDEIFERVNRYNADKYFSHNVRIDQDLDVAMDAIVRGDVRILKNLIVEGNLEVQGDEILFSKLQAMTKIESVDTIMKDRILELNKPTGAIDDSGNLIYNNWSDKIGNGVVGTRAYRGNNRDDYFFGFEEDRNCLVVGFIEEETEEHVRARAFKVAVRDDLMEHRRPAQYNEDTDRLETTDHIHSDVNGAVYMELKIAPAQLGIGVQKYTPVRIDTNGNIIKAHTQTLEDANVLGLVRDIKDVDGQKQVQVYLFGPVPLNVSAGNMGGSIFLDNNASIVTEVNYPDNTDYIVKELGQIIQPNMILLNPTITAKYVKVTYDDVEGNGDYSTDKVILDSYFSAGDYAHMKPVGATSNSYQIFSMAVHGINGLRGFMTKSHDNKIILADNNTIVDITGLIVTPTKLNDIIYLTPTNTLTLVETDIQVGEIVGVNQLRLNIKARHVVEPVAPTETIVNATKNYKKKLIANYWYKLNLEDNIVKELTLLEPGTPNFNIIYMGKSEGLAFIRNKEFLKSMGVFYISTSEEIYYKPILDQNSVFENELSEVPLLESNKIKQTIAR